VRAAPKHKDIHQFLRHDDYFRIDTGIGRRAIISRRARLWEGYFRAGVDLDGPEVVEIVTVSLWNRGARLLEISTRGETKGQRWTFTDTRDIVDPEKGRCEW
jgi:hypothetical protein